MLNWIKAFGLALAFIAAVVGFVALVFAIGIYCSPYVYWTLLLLIVVGFSTWALHLTL